MAEKELGWNDTIENDGSDFQLIPAGEYGFKVTQFERQRHNGSAKLPACPKAVLHLEIFDDDGRTLASDMTSNLFLHTKCEGFLTAFFRAIGARKHGEKMTMDWTKVPGATGRCKIKEKEFASNKEPGKMLKGNEIDKFLDPPSPKTDEKPAQTGTAFNPGDF